MRYRDHLEPRVLLDLEQGGRDAHIDGCEPCQDALRALERIQEALPDVGRDLVPDDDWERVVWARIEAERRRTSRLRRSAPALIGIAAVTAALLLSWPHRDASSTFRLSVDVQPGTAPSRAASPRPGASPVLYRGSPHTATSLVARAAGGDRYTAIWVYRDEDTLLIICPGDCGCSSGEELVAELSIPGGGRYQVVSLSSPRPLPSPSGAFDGDVAAAIRARIHVLVREIEIW